MIKLDSLEIIRKFDDSPDTSFIGEYTDIADEGEVIIRESGEWLRRFNPISAPQDIPECGREYRFFRPYAGGEKPFTKSGRINPLFRKYGMQDFKRMESLSRNDWCFVGLYAQAVIVNEETGVRQEITSGGLWGIESDSDDSYFKEVADEELGQLKVELEALGVDLSNWDELTSTAKTVEKY